MEREKEEDNKKEDNTAKAEESDNLPSGHILGGVAEEGHVVEDLAHGAAHLTRVPAVNAHVEEPAVVGLKVAGVVQLLAVGVDLGVVGAAEAVGEHL